MAGPAGFPRSSARTPWRRVHSPLGLSGNLAFVASPHRFTDPLGGYAMRPLGPGLTGGRAAASPALLGGARVDSQCARVTPCAGGSDPP